MVNIAEQPTAFDASAIRRRPTLKAAERKLSREKRKVHTGIDRELQRSPEAAVHFHQVQIAGPNVLFELHHRHAVPAETPKHAHGVLSDFGFDGHAFTQDTHATGGRLLTQATVTEFADEPSSIEQHEDADAGADDALLDERGV